MQRLMQVFHVCIFLFFMHVFSRLVSCVMPCPVFTALCCYAVLLCPVFTALCCVMLCCPALCLLLCASVNAHSCSPYSQDGLHKATKVQGNIALHLTFCALYFCKREYRRASQTPLYVPFGHL